MRLTVLPMGCLSSRSTVVPTETINQKTETSVNSSRERRQTGQSYNEPSGYTANLSRFGKTSENNVNDRNKLSMNSSDDRGNDDDLMSVLLKNKSGSSTTVNDAVRSKGSELRSPGGEAHENGVSDENSPRQLSLDQKDGERTPVSDKHSSVKAIAETPLDEEANLDLLREYVAIDYEITLLEDKDALLVYHERIEQLEQLERELDIITAEAEEITAGSDIELINRPAGQSSNRLQIDTENESITSAGAQSRKSRASLRNQGSNNAQQLVVRSVNGSVASQKSVPRNLSHSELDEVFNKKIILEKERDKLKKEVEMVIVECDALQNKYKKRDDILDKLFDGRTGNGLENHLEQQLHWLLEQKHYVDQVFYAWKRAETLTSQTCEQLANALELLKRLPEVEEPEPRRELVKSIESLLTKSLDDMEQAQKYNPNVDAPFFTDNETKRFDKIIATISDSNISQSDYSQISTVIQFVYKRAVSTRLWLEQILQTTIARDSFELAEEYKWISIQLRKERINLIKSRLQSPQYKSMVQSIHEKVAKQQAVDEHRKQRELNRDSGVESETNDIDIEEEIYRLLELNRFRLEANKQKTSMALTVGATKGRHSPRDRPETNKHPAHSGDRQLGVGRNTNEMSSASSSDSNERQHRDQQMRDRVQKRVTGEQTLRLADIVASMIPSPIDKLKDQQQSARRNESNNLSANATTKLKVELDEEAKQSLLKQVDQIHTRHRNRIDKIRGMNRLKANCSILDRIQQASPDNN